MTAHEDGSTTTNAALQAERAVNELYQRKMRDSIAGQVRVARERATTRNQLWTNPVIPTPLAQLVLIPLVGRVALAHEDTLLGRGFYIGPWHQEWDRVQVVSWAAPVASLFYSGHSSADSLAGDITARRTFMIHHDDLVGYVDELERTGDDGDPFAPTSARLAIPAPPAAAAAKAPLTELRRPQASPEPPRPTPRPVAETSRQPAARQPPAGEERAAPTDSGGAGRRPLRAERALRLVLERPRSGHLSPVLATLQPEQYRLVTWPETVPLVVQGQPGTGKTIIATHRAAYLTDPAREERPLRDVALVGPTEQYAGHVSRVIQDLRADEVRVVFLQQFFAGIADVGDVWRLTPTVHEDRLDADWGLGRVVERAAKTLREAGVFARARGSPTRVLVDALARPEPLLAPVLDAQSADVVEWLTAVGSFERVRNEQRFLPFLAAAALAARGSPSVTFSHLVVDEAQDVRLLEWRILLQHLRPGGGVTILGDINQRRSDWSLPTWQDLCVHLDLSSDEGFQAEVLDVGFRTTREILSYSNQLLPRGERTVNAIRNGPSPTVRRVSQSELLSAALQESEALATRHAEGLVAIISMDPQGVSDRFRNAGWTRPLELRHAWTRAGHTVLVLHPANARGLEFDGVVVVEPGSFPQNIGRLGLLYTSLTRAVQELVVVHAKSLPPVLGARPR